MGQRETDYNNQVITIRERTIMYIRYEHQRSQEFILGMYHTEKNYLYEDVRENTFTSSAKELRLGGANAPSHPLVTLLGV